MNRTACGSKELDSPPFPFPPPGASRGHRRLRCATARALRRPKAERSAAFWAGKEARLLIWGLAAPNPPLGVSGQRLDAVNRTFHLLIKPDNLTCYQQIWSVV